MATAPTGSISDGICLLSPSTRRVDSEWNHLHSRRLPRRPRSPDLHATGTAAQIRYTTAGGGLGELHRRGSAAPLPAAPRLVSKRVDNRPAGSGISATTTRSVPRRTKVVAKVCRRTWTEPSPRPSVWIKTADHVFRVHRRHGMRISDSRHEPSSPHQELTGRCAPGGPVRARGAGSGGRSRAGIRHIPGTPAPPDATRAPSPPRTPHAPDTPESPCRREVPRCSTPSLPTQASRSSSAASGSHE